MRRQADNLDRQADALREDAAAEEQRQYQAAMQATAEWEAYLTRIAPTATAIPSPTTTPQPTATATATSTSTSTSTPQPTAAQVVAQAEATEMVARARQAEDGAIVVAAMIVGLFLLIAWAIWMLSRLRRRARGHAQGHARKP